MTSIVLFMTTLIKNNNCPNDQINCHNTYHDQSFHFFDCSKSKSYKAHNLPSFVVDNDFKYRNQDSYFYLQMITGHKPFDLHGHFYDHLKSYQGKPFSG